MDYYREITKFLRMQLTLAVYEEMGKGMDAAQKTVLGNVIGIRYHQAGVEKAHMFDKPNYSRSHDQLFIFNELFGEPNDRDEFKTSPLLKEASDWINEQDFPAEDGYKILNLELEYRQDMFSLPLIRAFTISGIGYFEGINKDFRLEAK